MNKQVCTMLYDVYFWFAEGKTAAENYDCKYTEVSAILNHKVDDLLVGILKQIRLTLERSSKQKRDKKKSSSLRQTVRQESRDCPETGCLAIARSFHSEGALKRIIRAARGSTRSCERLFTP